MITEPSAPINEEFYRLTSYRLWVTHYAKGHGWKVTQPGQHVFQLLRSDRRERVYARFTLVPGGQRVLQEVDLIREGEPKVRVSAPYGKFELEEVRCIHHRLRQFLADPPLPPREESEEPLQLDLLDPDQKAVLEEVRAQVQHALTERDELKAQVSAAKTRIETLSEIVASKDRKILELQGKSAKISDAIIALTAITNGITMWSNYSIVKELTRIVGKLKEQSE